MGVIVRILRYLLWLLVLSWVVWLLKRMWTGGRGKSAAPPRREPEQAAKALVRDPWCGTHVAPEIAVRLEEGGQVQHFCSAECRERYMQSRARAVNE